MRKAVHGAVVIVAVLFGVVFWLDGSGTAQTAYIGLQARPSVAAVFLEFVRYQGKEVSESALRFNGTAWAAKSGSDGTWWLTNAHVVKAGGYEPPKPVLDRHERWWYPTGRQAVKTRDGRTLFAYRVVADGGLDLAAVRTAFRYEPLQSSGDDGIVPQHRIVVVGYPLSYRSVVSEGRVIQETGGGYDEGGIPEKDEDCDGRPPLTASVFLHDALMTFGGSGAPVISLETGRVIGVARGFYAAGNCLFSSGPSMQYAISGRHVVHFLQRLP